MGALRFHPAAYLRQAVSVLGIVALSVCATLLVEHLLAPMSAGAQSDQAQVLKASEFDLVDPDGLVQARLQAGARGGGNLVLFDAAGVQRVLLASGGGLTMNDGGGVIRLRAGYTTTVDGAGIPPFNGLLLDPEGTVDHLPTTP